MRRLLVVAAYLAGAFALYASTLHDRFQGDDFIWLYDASQLASPLDLFRVHHAEFARLDGIRLSPVELGFFWINLRLFGMTPLPFHCALLVVVALNAWLLHLWVRRLTESDMAGAAAAVTFLVYPLHYEPHGWLAAVNEPLLGAFSVACLLAFLRARRDGWRPGLPLAAAALLGALVTKPSAVALPLVLLAADLVLCPPAPLARRLRIHAPFWGIVAAAGAWHAVAIHAARGAAYTVERPNDLAVILCGTVRYTLGLFLGFERVAGLPPALDVRPPPEAWAVICIAGLLYGCLCYQVVPRVPSIGFHLLWIPLAMAPYAAMVPSAPLEARYAWQGSLGLAGTVGCASALLAPQGWRLAVALCAAWMLCARTLVATVGPLTAPDDTAALAAQVRAATADLAPQGRLYVYQQAAQQHAAGRAAALFAGVPAERVRDWYDVLSQGRLEDGDVMLFWEPHTRTFMPMDAEVRRALAAPRTPPTDRIDASGLPVLRSWDMRDREARDAWRGDGLERDLDAPIWHVRTSADSLVSPPLDLAPFDVFCVEVVYHTLHAGQARLEPRLGWSSPLENGWGPQRYVPGALAAREGKAAAWFFPASRASWWKEGGVRRFYFAPSPVALEVSIDRITIYGVPKR